MTSDTNLATVALADAAPVELAPDARGPAVAGAVTALVAIGFGFTAGRILGDFAGFALALEVLILLAVAGIAAAGFVGLDAPWWSVALGKRWPQLAGRRTTPWPGFLFFMGAALAAPAATHLGVLAWATDNPRASGFAGPFVLAWAAELVGWIGLLAILVIAWRVCFAPFASDWPRWVPLPILGAGAVAGVAMRPNFDAFASAHWWVTLLAIAWGVALGFATPARLGYSAPRRASSLTLILTYLEEPRWSTPRLPSLANLPRLPSLASVPRLPSLANLPSVRSLQRLRLRWRLRSLLDAIRRRARTSPG